MAGRPSDLRISAAVWRTHVCSPSTARSTTRHTFRFATPSSKPRWMNLGVIVDVTGLTVREDPAWAVFTSARWQIAEWPDIPIGLVCAHEQGRECAAPQRHNSIRARVPDAVSPQSLSCPPMDCAGTGGAPALSLPATRSSIRRCRELTAQWLTAWARTDFIHVVSTVATELVEAALGETDSDFALRVETDGSTVSVAIQHVGMAKPTCAESPQMANVSGLDLVAANSRAWGTTPRAGNTVWAVVGPENASENACHDFRAARPALGPSGSPHFSGLPNRSAPSAATVLRARAAVFVAVGRWAKNATQATAVFAAIRSGKQWCLRSGGSRSWKTACGNRRRERRAFRTTSPSRLVTRGGRVQRSTRCVPGPIGASMSDSDHRSAEVRKQADKLSRRAPQWRTSATAKPAG